MIATAVVFPLSRIFFLGVKIDPTRFHVKRFVNVVHITLLETCSSPSPLVGLLRNWLVVIL